MIHRNKKERNFVTLDKTALNDTGLSWAAKGLHSYLMGLPDDWRVTLEDLTRRALDGKHSATTAMNELIRAGYVVRRKVVNAKNQFAGYEYQMFETPQEAEVWGAVHGKTVVGKPDYGKSEHGESVNGKSHTTKELRKQSIDLLSIEETSIEEMPARESAASVRITEGQPVIDFEGQTTLLDLRSGTEITGPGGSWVCNECNCANYTGSVSKGDIESGNLSCVACGCDEFHWVPAKTAEITGRKTPKDEKPKKQRKYMTPGEQWPPENEGPENGWRCRDSVQVFGEWLAARYPDLDPEAVFGDMQQWAVNRGYPDIKKAGGYDWSLVPASWMRKNPEQRKKWAKKQQTAAEQFEQQTGIPLTPMQQTLVNLKAKLEARKGEVEV